MKWLIYYILLFITFNCHAQNAKTARKTIFSLTSKAFWGRGYTKNGMYKAGNYMTDAFKKLGLQPMDDKNFKQPFNYAVNTFAGKMTLHINGKKLIAGKDFIINSGSVGGKTNDRLIEIDSTHFYTPNKQVRIILVDKLTWTVATDTIHKTEIMIRKSALKTSPKQLSIDIENTFIPAFEANNICAIVKGYQKPDSIIIITAHYDHLGGMGAKTYFPGANDNASGVALLLNLAKYYAQHPQPYSIGFICFAGEEAGLLGSKYFTEHPLVDLHHIRFLINLDLVGTGEKGIMVVNATSFPHEFDMLHALNKKNNWFTKINARGKAANSDHYFFSEKGVPAFFIYTQGGIAAYHDVWDRAKTLPLTKYNELFKLIVAFNQLLTN